VLPRGLKLSPEQFALVCEANPEAVLELSPAGQVIAITPTGGDTSARNNLLSARLQVWALGQGGWKVFDSSGGFRLPDGSVLSPDAASRPCAPTWWWRPGGGAGEPLRSHRLLRRS
jgi:Uma2 family endonuclease